MTMLRRPPHDEPGAAPCPTSPPSSSLPSAAPRRPLRSLLARHRRALWVTTCVGAAGGLGLRALLGGGDGLSALASYRPPYHHHGGSGGGSGPPMLVRLRQGRRPSTATRGAGAAAPSHHSPPSADDPCFEAEGRLHAAYLAGRAFCDADPTGVDDGDGYPLEPAELTCGTATGPSSSSSGRWWWGGFGGGEQPRRRVTAYVHAGRHDIISNEIRRYGKWEDEEAELLLRLMEAAWRGGYFEGAGVEKEELVVLDIGANLGAHALCLAAGGYQVLAFEPMAHNLAALRRSLCANPDLLDRVTVLPFGLGERAQNCTLVVSPTNSGDGMLRCNDPRTDRQQVFGPEETAQTNVPVLTLDGALFCPIRSGGNGRGRRRVVAGVKMDVEAYELAVVRGGEQFLKAHRPPVIVYENIIMPYQRRRDLVDFFLEQGYVYGCVQSRHQPPVPDDFPLPADTREAFDTLPAEGNELLFDCVDVFWADRSLVEERAVPVYKGGTRAERRLFLGV